MVNNGISVHKTDMLHVLPREIPIGSDKTSILFIFVINKINKKITIMTLREFNHRILSLQDSLQYYAYSLTSSSDDADDLLQDTFFKALSNKEKFDPATNMKAWTYTIMKNTFINNYRKMKRSNTIIDNSQDLYYINSSQKSTSINPHSHFNHGEIMKAIRELEDNQRIPFEKHIEGFKYKEIAEELNLPIGTVKSRIFLTRKKLSRKLKDYQN